MLGQLPRRKTGHGDHTIQLSALAIARPVRDGCTPGGPCRVHDPGRARAGACKYARSCNGDGTGPAILMVALASASPRLVVTLAVSSSSRSSY